MVEKIFLLGRPGSGKSTAAQVLTGIAQKSGWDTLHIYDYKHLHNMFQQEIDDGVPVEERSFRQKGPDACQGFDVCKFDVLDKALQKMVEEVRKEELIHSGARKLLLIEFARKEYGPALHFFSDILYGSYLFYLKLGLKVCIERVKQRADEHRLRSEYDHFVSEDIMRGFYRYDDWLDGRLNDYLAVLKRDGIYIRAEEINNIASPDTLSERIEELASPWLTSELAVI